MNFKTRIALMWLAGSMTSIGVAAPSALDAELQACGHLQEREVISPRANKPAITLKTMQPAESSYVTEQTMVVAELEYDIDRFEPDMYALNVQFQTTDPHATTSGAFTQNPELQFAHGTIRFCYPLRGIWSHPNAKWPLGMLFYLMHRNDDGSFAVVASTAITHFNTARLPAAALNSAAPTAEQLATHEAVGKLAVFFETTTVHVRLCSESFPEMKSSLQPPLDAWHKRHAAVQEKSDALYLDSIRQRMPGMTNVGILTYLEASRTAIEQALRQTPEALSERNCKLMPGRLAGGDYDPAKRYPEEYELVRNFSMR